MNAGDWINLAGVAVAAGSAIFAANSARRAKDAEEKADGYRARAQQDAERATKAAEESAAAQRQSATAAKRAADALEAQNQLASEARQAAEGVPWHVEHSSGAIWKVRNTSALPKFRVSLSGPGVNEARSSKLVDKVDGNSSIEFWGNTFWGAKQVVTVTWHAREDGQDAAQRWTDVMPPR
ncbi:hypothetical protein [Mycobacterium sp.]|uniref:hypothetical protein n=1 Tax=Mycobacterium sp. TaxID=1785 RepID=UPI0025D7D4D2|nr:hypothetical protein [Mycobacterium sp.]